MTRETSSMAGRSALTDWGWVGAASAVGRVLAGGERVGGQAQLEAALVGFDFPAPAGQADGLAGAGLGLGEVPQDHVGELVTGDEVAGEVGDGPGEGLPGAWGQQAGLYVGPVSGGAQHGPD